MATYTGTTGSVTYNSSTVAQVTGWELNTSLGTVDDTAIGEKWVGRSGTVAEGSGRLSLVYDYTAGQKEITDDLVAATPTLTGATCVLTVNTGKTFTFVMIPTSVGWGIDAKGDLVASVDFVADGVVTLAWV